MKVSRIPYVGAFDVPRLAGVPFPAPSSHALGEEVWGMDQYLEYVGNVSRASTRDRAPFVLFGGEAEMDDPLRNVWLTGADRVWAAPFVEAARAAFVETARAAGKATVTASTDTPPIFQAVVGPPNAGSPMHSHHRALNILLHGRKRWLLLPPRHTYYSTVPPGPWRDALEDPATGRAPPPFLECVQTPGDVLYLPHVSAEPPASPHAYASPFTRTDARTHARPCSMALRPSCPH